MRTVVRVGSALLILLVVAAGWYGGWPRTSAIDGSDAIAELTSVDIGGLEQWLLIRGDDRSNPVLLWLHGGPGAAQMPVHRAFNRDLEEDFVVVHWDQRGAGKSNHRGFSEETMSLDQFVADVHELTRYLTDRFAQKQIYLLGHSWGALLGMHVADRHPAHYRAFISVAQPVNARQADSLSHAWLKAQVEASDSSDKMRDFETHGDPPFEEHARYVAFAQMKDRFGGSTDVPMGRLMMQALRATEYSWLDYPRWLRGANRGSGPMWEETSRHDLFRQIPRVDVPVLFIAGEKDYNTPTALIEAYFDALDAPRGKDFIRMEGVAHTPFLGDPKVFREAVLRVKEWEGRG